MSNRPSKVVKLTKAQITNGRNYTEDVFIPALGGELTIRVLTQGEIDDIVALGGRGVSIDLTALGADLASNGDLDANDPEVRQRAMQGMVLDLPLMFEMTREQRYRTVAYGLTVKGGEVWTVDDVKGITAVAGEEPEAGEEPAPPGDPIEQIAREVWRISRVSESDLSALKQFRPGQ